MYLRFGGFCLRVSKNMCTIQIQICFSYFPMITDLFTWRWNVTVIIETFINNSHPVCDSLSKSIFVQQHIDYISLYNTYSSRVNKICKTCVCVSDLLSFIPKLFIDTSYFEYYKFSYPEFCYDFMLVILQQQIIKNIFDCVKSHRYFQIYDSTLKTKGAIKIISHDSDYYLTNVGVFDDFIDTPSVVGIVDDCCGVDEVDIGDADGKDNIGGAVENGGNGGGMMMREKKLKMVLTTGIT